jgi:RimJ/RimL family protein N-acetyltransferase/predicted N-acetyltransferase YhbS
VTDLASWTPRPRPDGSPIEGRYVRLERLDPGKHASDLAAELSGPKVASLYDYLGDPAPTGPADVVAWVEKATTLQDPFFYAVIDKATGRALGRMALMRIDPAHGVIEVGSILYGPKLQRTRGASECISLLGRYVFETLGYRRFEWKCNDRNEASKQAAFRFGFQYEGLFRNHMVVKGENRDTAWFAMTEEDWRWIAPAHALWLDPGNFDADGRQRAPLSAFLARVFGDDALELVRARPGDVGAIRALQQASYAPNRDILGVEPVPLQWDYDEIVATHEVWVDRWPGPFDGALVLKPRSEDLEISSIAVAPEAQGSGLGNLLLEAAEARARALGKRTVRLYSGEALTRNIAWYQRRGYAIERVEQRADRRIVHFVKQLNEKD